MDQIRRTDIRSVVSSFVTGQPYVKRLDEGTVPPCSLGLDRERSFDFCFNYFRHTEKLTDDMEKSCLALGYYLASWGMLRGSTFLFKHTNSRHYWKTIEYIEANRERLQAIDVDRYDESGKDALLKCYGELSKCLLPCGGAHVVLVTKVMLGAFGNLPAFDSYWVRTFREIFSGRKGSSFGKVSPMTLGFISDFYQSNATVIDELSSSLSTIDFETGDATNINIPRAKVIDMYGFRSSWGKPN